KYIPRAGGWAEPPDFLEQALKSATSSSTLRSSGLQLAGSLTMSSGKNEPVDQAVVDQSLSRR
ncbi:MAG: hypothetical protein WBF66_07810, partial [Dehalococcoidia bacterium]